MNSFDGAMERQDVVNLQLIIELLYFILYFNILILLIIYY